MPPAIPEHLAGLAAVASRPDPAEPVDVEPVPREAVQIFGEQLPSAVDYAGILAERGRVVGVIGPREAGRIWSRHLVNCAAIAPLVPASALVADVGSGAGLPGIPLALARPDLHVRLIESLGRRVRFLQEVVEHLALQERVTIVRGRAEESARGEADVVTARAVADLPTLATWCLPLARPRGGVVLALRGESAGQELAALRPSLRQRRASGELLELAGVRTEPPARVVRLVRS